MHHQIRWGTAEAAGSSSSSSSGGFKPPLLQVCQAGRVRLVVFQSSSFCKPCIVTFILNNCRNLSWQVVWGRLLDVLFCAWSRAL
jgi:hypothetical protein